MAWFKFYASSSSTTTIMTTRNTKELHWSHITWLHRYVMKGRSRSVHNSHVERDLHRALKAKVQWEDSEEPKVVSAALWIGTNLVGTGEVKHNDFVSRRPRPAPHRGPDRGPPAQFDTFPKLVTLVDTCIRCGRSIAASDHICRARRSFARHRRIHL